MENIFSKIDKIFEQDSDDTPKWAQELLCELKEIKELLKKSEKPAPKIVKKESTDIKSFIRGFRKMLKKDEKFIYQGRELGINTNGLLYDINTHSVLMYFEAYEVYGYIFKHNITILKIDSLGETA